MRIFFVSALVLAFFIRGAGAFSITFDFSTDTGDFFATGSPERATLLAAGGFFEGIILDDFDAITPNTAWDPPAGVGEDMWQVNYTHPSTGLLATDDFLTVAADTIIVYVGARDLGGSTLGEGGRGGVAAEGSASFINSIVNRGESGTTSGPGADEYAPWGGFLSLDSDSTWHSDHLTDPGVGENDLYSIILHELGHVLGIGTADSWTELVNTVPNPDTFTGAEAVAEYGGEINLESGNAHFELGTTSTEYGGGPAQESALSPGLTAGERKIFTDLDVAALDDIGWDITPVPEPSSVFLASVALVVLSCGRRSRLGGRG